MTQLMIAAGYSFIVPLCLLSHIAHADIRFIDDYDYKLIDWSVSIDGLQGGLTTTDHYNPNGQFDKDDNGRSFLFSSLGSRIIFDSDISCMDEAYYISASTGISKTTFVCNDPLYSGRGVISFTFKGNANSISFDYSVTWTHIFEGSLSQKKTVRATFDLQISKGRCAIRKGSYFDAELDADGDRSVRSYQANKRSKCELLDYK